jgi:hypothetical protein
MVLTKLKDGKVHLSYLPFITIESINTLAILNFSKQKKAKE